MGSNGRIAMLNKKESGLTDFFTYDDPASSSLFPLTETQIPRSVVSAHCLACSLSHCDVT